MGLLERSTDMRTAWMLTGSLALALFAVGCKEKQSVHEGAGHSMAKAQTVCPVMGNKIDKSLYADHMGKRVYFCCGMCPPKFNEDPMKYMKKLEAEGVMLEKAPAGASGSDHKPMEHGGEPKEMDDSEHGR